jgi:pimeloyl-ACP methyl ester carboxylesterase
LQKKQAKLKQIQFKNTSISYSDTGKVPLLSASWFPRKQMWMCNYIPTLKEQVITIDLLGHGETECLGYVHSMEDNADAVHIPFYQNCIRKSILVGHSMGGYVFGFRRMYPEYVKAWFVEFNSQSRAKNEK